MIVEKALELAHSELIHMVENEIDLYTTDDNGDLIYKENYQDIFNKLYDQYFSTLTDEQI